MGGPWAEPLLARDRVRFAGEPVAVVLTDDSHQGDARHVRPGLGRDQRGEGGAGQQGPVKEAR